MLKSALKIISFTGMALTIGLAGAYYYVISTSESILPIKKCMTTSMNSVRLCPGSGSYTRLSEISQVLKDAIVYSEDASFYHHSGFDFHEIRASFFSNLKKQRFFRGGSTLTQQLVKNVFLSPNKTLIRKLREAYLTVKVEELLSKEEILEKYLNVVEFGPKLYGIQAAAGFYFDKSAAQLNLLESTYLAHLLPNPRVYSRGFQKGQLTEFSNKQVLNLCRRLFRFKKITEWELTAATENLHAFPWTF